MLRSGGPAVFASHQSAAALHALPLWGLDLSRVHVTAPHGRGGCVGGVHRHIRDPVGPGIQVWNKLRMVSPARAVVEVAATSPAAPAVVLAEAALYAGLVTTRSLKRAAADHGNERAIDDDLPGRRGVSLGRRVPPPPHPRQRGPARAVTDPTSGRGSSGADRRRDRVLVVPRRAHRAGVRATFSLLVRGKRARRRPARGFGGRRSGCTRSARMLLDLLDRPQRSTPSSSTGSAPASPGHPAVPASGTSISPVPGCE